MDDDELLWDLDNIPSEDNDVDSQLDIIDDDNSPLPDGIDERNIEEILSQVRTQYAKLQEENSKLLQLIDMVKKKIEQCVKKEGCFGVGSRAEPLSVPMNLDVKNEAFYRSEVEEEDDEDEEIILGGF